MSMHERLAQYERLRALAERGAGEIRPGRLTARERVDRLFDPGTFVELDRFATSRADQARPMADRAWGEGVLTGHGRVEGRPVCVYAQDINVLGGTVSEGHASKICKVMDLAVRIGAPIVGLVDSGGARIQDGVDAMAGYGEIFWRNTRASGVVPQISAILGPCAGGAVYSPAITDFVFMVPGTSYMFLAGPSVVKSALHEDVTKDQLGGAAVHGVSSGVAHFLLASEADCLQAIRRLLGFLPSNNLDPAPPGRGTDLADRRDEALLSVLPEDAAAPYDVRDVLLRVVDDGAWMEVRREFAGNVVCGFAHLGGRAVGIVATQPAVLAGALDSAASVKAASFVRFCDAFHLPIVTFQDVPGYLPGTAEEHGGIIRNGAKLLYAYCEATVPKITVLLRKAYGGAYLVLGSRQVGADMVFAWPTAEIAVMGARSAVELLYRKQIDAADDRGAAVAELSAVYERDYAHPWVAAARGYVDDVIDPRDTRPRLIAALAVLQSKRDPGPARKHGCIPL